MEAELGKVILKNNQLIEKIRSLEREKNEYFHQMKRYSKVGSQKENLSKSGLKR